MEDVMPRGNWDKITSARIPAIRQAAKQLAQELQSGNRFRFGEVSEQFLDLVRILEGSVGDDSFAPDVAAEVRQAIRRLWHGTKRSREDTLPDLIEEFRVATEPAGHDRLRFDDLTQTVWLDGAPHAVADPKAYAVYLAIAADCPQPITKARLQAKVRGCSGEKKIPALLTGLPDALSQTIHVGTNGYWLNLGRTGDSKTPHLADSFTRP
jgi:hypothetical protein